jgi:hypothetical protein
LGKGWRSSRQQIIVIGVPAGMVVTVVLAQRAWVLVHQNMSADCVQM